jgi:hypothetical protein
MNQTSFELILTSPTEFFSELSRDTQNLKRTIPGTFGILGTPLLNPIANTT